MDRPAKSIYDILITTFGYSSFRDQQEDIIQTAIAGQDSLVIMPTGGGKSLCYQIPALYLGPITIVISPLIALMEDQVAALKQLDIATECIHSGMDTDQKKHVFRQLNRHALHLLYISPESFLTESFLDYIRTHPIKLFAIDEAHCISVWGNDFRPEYTRLSLLKELFPDIPIIALTATADAATQKDIADKLNIAHGRHFVSSFERSNITINATPGRDRLNQMYNFLKDYKNESGIIYCLSRKSTEDIADKLKQKGFKTAYYHAGMDNISRSRVQQRFQNDEISIVCATIAFGMGIDKSNVRFVIHYNLPKNIEGFYQEIGRAGRDGLPSESLLFYSWADHERLRSFIEDSSGDDTFKTVQSSKLERMWEFANASTCRTNMILSYFGEYHTKGCGHCDNCIDPPDVFDGTVLTQKALSGIIRTHESLNLNSLIDFLKGSPRSEFSTKGLDALKTFGAGRDLPFLHWKSYITQMINKGLISIDYTDHNKLKITPLSKAALQGDVIVELVDHKSLTKVAKKKPTKKALVEEDLFEKLRQWRLVKAKELNVPAYVIFSDATLKAIAEEKPIVADDLSMIAGIGDIKRTRFGEEIIEVIRSYLKEQNHTAKIKGSTHLETLQYLHEGLSVEEIARLTKLNPVTVYSHIAALYERGENIDLTRWVKAEELEQIGAHWNDTGKPESLKELFNSLNGVYDYYKLRLSIAYYKKLQLSG